MPKTSDPLEGMLEQKLAGRYTPETPEGLSQRIINTALAERRSDAGRVGLMNKIQAFWRGVVASLEASLWPQALPRPAYVTVVLMVTVVVGTGVFFVDNTQTDVNYSDSAEVWASLMLDNDFDPSEWL